MPGSKQAAGQDRSIELFVINKFLPRLPPAHNTHSFLQCRPAPDPTAALLKRRCERLSLRTAWRSADVQGRRHGGGGSEPRQGKTRSSSVCLPCVRTHTHETLRRRVGGQASVHENTDRPRHATVQFAAPVKPVERPGAHVAHPVLPEDEGRGGRNRS